MTRWQAIALGTLLGFTLFSSLLLAPSSQARATAPQARVRQARRDLSKARTTLRSARAAYSAAKSAGQQIGLDALHHDVVRARAAVRRLRALLDRLECRCTLRRAIARRQWRVVIRLVAAREHVSATGLSRMMTLESGGRADATSGPYCGLFQYCSSTWHGAWNPWRGRSIFDGEAQIRATARAIHRGWGASMWPGTYRMAF